MGKVKNKSQLSTVSINHDTIRHGNAVNIINRLEKQSMVSSDAPAIIQATLKDIDDLARLIRHSFKDVARRFDLTPANCPKHPSNYTSKWVRRDLARGVRYFILKIDGTAVGCVGLEQASAQICYMERLAVLPHYRGNGYGTRLARHAIAQAHKWGAAHVDIGIIAADSGLAHFYRNLRFEAGETRTFPHLPFEVSFLRYAL